MGHICSNLVLEFDSVIESDSSPYFKDSDAEDSDSSPKDLDLLDSTTTSSLCCCTTLGKQKSIFVINYERYVLKIAPYVIKMRHCMSCGEKHNNTVTPVACVSISCSYT